MLTNRLVPRLSPCPNDGKPGNESSFRANTDEICFSYYKYTIHILIVVLYYLQLLKVISLVPRPNPDFYCLQWGESGNEARKYFGVYLTVISDGEGVV